MLTWNPGSRAGWWLLAASLALPSAAGADIFAWRTEDGVFAYTDDRDSIPARYADEAVAVRDTRLDGYPRLTVEDTSTSRALATRLEKRLDHLRQVNAGDASPAGASPATGRTTLSVATGSPQAPTLDVTTDVGAGPIVVEPILTKEGDRVRTRRATIVKQGDRTLAVLKGRSHHVNPSDDIYDEDRLLESR